MTNYNSTVMLWSCWALLVVGDHSRKRRACACDVTRKQHHHAGQNTRETSEKRRTLLHDDECADSAESADRLFWWDDPPQTMSCAAMPAHQNILFRVSRKFSFTNRLTFLLLLMDIKNGIRAASRQPQVQNPRETLSVWWVPTSEFQIWAASHFKGCWYKFWYCSETLSWAWNHQKQEQEQEDKKK